MRIRALEEAFVLYSKSQFTVDKNNEWHLKGKELVINW